MYALIVLRIAVRSAEPMPLLLLILTVGYFGTSLVHKYIDIQALIVRDIKGLMLTCLVVMYVMGFLSSFTLLLL